MTTGGQLTNLTNPQAIFAAADPGTHLRQLHRHDLAARHRDFRLAEPGFRPGRFGKFVVGDAGDPMLLPHLPEESRTVAFAIENDHEAAEIGVGLELFGRGLTGNILDQTRHHVVTYSLE